MAHTYSNEVLQLAQMVQREYNIPASVTLAAYSLESGYGTSNLAKNNNNYFGITGSGTAGYTIGSHKWAKYNNMEESFRAFGKLLSNQRYSNLTKNAKNVEEYIYAYADTYAPPSDGNSNYAGKMLSIIQKEGLSKYDTGLRVNLADVQNFGGSEGGKIDDYSPSVSSSDKGGFLVTVCTFAALLFLFAAALFFIMQAFNINPRKIAASAVLKKAGVDLPEEVIENV